MFWLQFISKFLKVLRSGESPGLIAGGFAMGFIVGLTPFLTLQNVVILLIVFLTKVNLASTFFSIFVFSFVAYLFDPAFHDLGFFLLTQIDSLVATWTALYNWPLAPLTRFNNTIVMGSFVSALALLFPVYFLFKKGIVAYRARWAERIEKSKFMKALKSNVIFKWYIKVRDLEF